MTDALIDVAGAGNRAARRRLALYAACTGVQVRRGPGWFAVATGVVSNDMNGVVSRAGTSVPDALIDELVGWFAELAMPASWLTSAPDSRVTAALVERGSTPERTGWWAGRQLDRPLPVPEVAADVVIDRVHSGDDLNDWLDVAGSCGWVGSSEDRSARRTLYSVIGLDHSHLTHWIARRGGTPVGMASSFVDSDVIDLCNLAVVEPHRRTGIGRGLVIRRVLESQRLGARLAVSALSPPGWQLYRPLGFASVPVVADTWFYLPEA